MPSGFISADSGKPYEAPARAEEWAQAAAEISQAQRAAAAASAPGTQDGGKSLFEVLQANKAAKTEAAEEAAKLKNQFRSLDEDEVEYLDAVRDAERARDAEVRRETAARLEAFRRQRDQTGGDGHDADAVEQVEWSAGQRKRKKAAQAIAGVKVRKTGDVRSAASTAGQAAAVVENAASTPVESEATHEASALDKPTPTNPALAVVGSKSAKTASTAIESKPTKAEPEAKQTVSAKPATTPASGGLGLGAYSSDED